jgi:predicted nucleic acid-binding protein
MNGERLLLDTTFIVGLINRRDQHHSQAQKYMPRVQAAYEIFITEAILMEVGNLLHPTQNRIKAADFIESCYSTPNINVIPVETVLLKRALEFYRKHNDKDWGLTDCISFVVMSENGLTLAVTADTDFQQAGFRALMLEPF